MSKNSPIDSIRVGRECHENWNEMTGGDTVRFCGHCAKNVNNLTAMTRKEAARIVRESGGNLCVRFEKNPADGSPVFAPRLHQIARRPTFAAGILGASLVLAGVAAAQTVPQATTRTVQIENEKQRKDETISGSGLGSVVGNVTDPNGALVPGSTVRLVNTKSGETRSFTTNDEGRYDAGYLPIGTYRMEVEKSGFVTSKSDEFTIDDGVVQTRDVLLNTGEYVTMGVVSVMPFVEPLVAAVDAREIEVVRDLISRGKDVNQADEIWKITPLFVAVDNGDVEIAETLLSFGAKTNVRDADRRTPLMRLDDDATVELVDLLFRHGAKVNLVDNEGNNALMLAAPRTGADVLARLIARTTNINRQNNDGRTALMLASREDNFENVKALLEAGANVGLRDKNGDSALDLAGDANIADLLISYGAKQ